MIIGVDTGGTFTDFIYKKGDTWGVYKILSTPKNPAEAVLKGIRDIAGKDKALVVHGSTVATNAILEKKGAKTALITNKGFEDVLEIGRQNRHELYNLAFRKDSPLVPDRLRFGVKCRVDYNGNVLDDLDEDELRGVLEAIKKENVASIAVSFLFSFVYPEHEKRVSEICDQTNIPVSLSHEILSEFREFERTSTVVINAYVLPKMEQYIGAIVKQIGANHLRIMQSNGGSITARTAQKESVRTILSGPAGGVVGGFEIGKLAGHKKLITFDMGGTSTDVSLIDGTLPLTFESTIAGLPVKVPMIDIHTVGAGGGSIAYLDTGGSLKVGPESAGAFPGPICYGNGDRITVTDANLFLGRLIPENFLGGKMTLKAEKLEHHFKKASKPIGLTSIELAEGILSVVNSSMERAIRVISVEKGFDPAEFTLFSFGGAGGMHACFLASLLSIPSVFVPKNPGILSATGMLLADIVKDYSQTVMLDHSAVDVENITRLFMPIEKKGYQDLTMENLKKEHMVFERYLDMRYKGQSYEITVPFETDFLNRFHFLHEKKYGYFHKDKPIEIVNIRLRARGLPQKVEFEKSTTSSSKPSKDSVLGTRETVFGGKTEKTQIFSRDKLACGNIIEGPALVVEYSSTTVLPLFARAEVDEYGNLVIRV